MGWLQYILEKEGEFPLLLMSVKVPPQSVLFHVSLAANAGTDSAWAKVENWSFLWNSGVGNKKPLIDYYSWNIGFNSIGFENSERGKIAIIPRFCSLANSG